MTNHSLFHGAGNTSSRPGRNLSLAIDKTSMIHLTQIVRIVLRLRQTCTIGRACAVDLNRASRTAVLDFAVGCLNIAFSLKVARGVSLIEWRLERERQWVRRVSEDRTASEGAKFHVGMDGGVEVRLLAFFH